jgi:hypothetical protein
MIISLQGTDDHNVRARGRRCLYKSDHSFSARSIYDGLKSNCFFIWWPPWWAKVAPSSAEKGQGKVKEVVGKGTGDSKLESEGKADTGAIGSAEFIPRQVLHHPLS